MKTLNEHETNITTLRAEVERLKEQLESPFMDGYETAKEEYRPRLIAAEAENEKLRAALEEINVGEGWAALIARAALEENTNG